MLVGFDAFAGHAVVEVVDGALEFPQFAHLTLVPPKHPHAAVRVGRNSAGFWLEYGDGATIGGLDEARALYWTVHAVQDEIARSGRGYAFIHAGAVVIDGVGVVLPGKSGAGKSTLVAALVHSGAVLLSDEYVPIDVRGQLAAFPRQLYPTDDPLTSAGTPSASKMWSPALVVITRFDQFTRWHAQRVGSATVAGALIQNSFSARESPEDSLRAIAAAAQQVVGLAGQRGDAVEAAVEIFKAVRRAESATDYPA